MRSLWISAAAAVASLPLIGWFWICGLTRARISQAAVAWSVALPCLANERRLAQFN